jgi:hypothetical protein
MSEFDEIAKDQDVKPITDLSVLSGDWPEGFRCLP